MMEMDEKSFEQIKNLITDFRLLASKLQKYNEEKIKKIKRY